MTARGRAGLLLSLMVLARAPAARAEDFVCTEVLGVSVTGDWFGAGFENGIDGDRWQVRWRPQAFLQLWADPANTDAGMAVVAEAHREQLARR